jgi:uncharacterized protein YcbX
MSEIYLSRIRIYPIKGCAGTDVEKAYLDERGLRYDRRWMLVNEYGNDLHQLRYPRLAMITVSLSEDGLLVQAPEMPPLCLPLQPQHSDPVMVRWYEGYCEALSASDEADAWFAEFLHDPCQLVFMPESTERYVAPEYAVNHDLAAFTSFQYHLLGEASLADLNQRLQTPVPLGRFRPNLVVSGAAAFAEDTWRTLQINDHIFHIVRACDRCAITTVDAITGVMTGKEPMATLARYRTFDKKVLFGQYLLAGCTGVIHVGDAVKILAYK